MIITPEEFAIKKDLIPQMEVACDLSICSLQIATWKVGVEMPSVTLRISKADFYEAKKIIPNLPFVHFNIEIDPYLKPYAWYILHKDKGIYSPGV